MGILGLADRVAARGRGLIQVARWLLKLLIVAGLCTAVLPAVARIAWTQALWLGIPVAVVTYVVGDRGALARWGNPHAVVVDFVAATATLYLVAAGLPGVRLPFGGALTAGGAVAVGEIFYHRYLLHHGVGT